MQANDSRLYERKRSSDENHPIKEFNNNSGADAQYQRDKARIIHSASFRRLQSKTQVLTIGESDFYRTRLTHSLEVAQIGSSICENLRNNLNLSELHSVIPPTSLIEAIGLAHDLGHPPFGHGGEIALNSLMKEHGGFEGNGQTLRISATLGEYSPGNGLDLTRRAMLGLLKYPATHGRLKNYSDTAFCKPPKCIHDNEIKILEWILVPFEKSDIEVITKIIASTEIGKHHKTVNKSLDTSIMELADDIAYGVHDLEDAIALHLVSRDSWISYVIDNSNEFSDSQIIRDYKFYTSKLFSESSKDRKHAISKMVNYFISNITIIEKNDASSPFIKYNATMSNSAALCLARLKNFIREMVICTPQVRSLEFKGQLIISKLFSVFLEAPQDLLPKNTYEAYKNSQTKERIICDFIAGMTDSYAARMYRRLFVPDVGSIFDHF